MTLAARPIIDARKTDLFDSRKVTAVYGHFVERLTQTFRQEPVILARGPVHESVTRGRAVVADRLMPRHVPDGLPVVIFPAGCAWVDDGVAEMLEMTPRDGVALFAFQPGYDLVVIGGDAERPRNRMDFRRWVRVQARHDERFRVHARAVGQRNVYLRTDLAQALDLLLHVYETGGALTPYTRDRRYTIFGGNNRKKIIRMIERIDAICGVRGKRILEIGASVTSDVAADILINHYDARYTGNNILDFQYDIPGARLLRQDVREMDFPKDSFDLIFSIGVMEHVPDPIGLMRRSENWLARGGMHFVRFQIWSGKHGHHVFAPRFPAQHVPDFAQLTMSADDMRRHLADKVEDDVIERMIEMAYSGSEINRVGIEHYLAYFAETPMELLYLDGMTGGLYNEEAVRIANSQDVGYSAEMMSCFGLEFALRKSDFDLRRLMPGRSDRGEGISGSGAPDR
jgi:hypothetical protein